MSLLMPQIKKLLHSDGVIPFTALLTFVTLKLFEHLHDWYPDGPRGASYEEMMQLRSEQLPTMITGHAAMLFLSLGGILLWYLLRRSSASPTPLSRSRLLVQFALVMVLVALAFDAFEHSEWWQLLLFTGVTGVIGIPLACFVALSRWHGLVWQTEHQSSLHSWVIRGFLIVNLVGLWFGFKEIADLVTANW